MTDQLDALTARTQALIDENRLLLAQNDALRAAEPAADSRPSEGLDAKFVRKLLGDHHRVTQTTARNCSLCWNARAALREDPR